MILMFVNRYGANLLSDLYVVITINWQMPMEHFPVLLLLYTHKKCA